MEYDSLQQKCHDRRNKIYSLESAHHIIVYENNNLQELLKLKTTEYNALKSEYEKLSDAHYERENHCVYEIKLNASMESPYIITKRR